MDNKEKAKTVRCDECKKKVGLMAMKCRCEKTLCTSHITAELHSCTFDYRTEGVKTLSTVMVTVTGNRGLEKF